MTIFRLHKQDDRWVIVNENRDFAAGAIKCVVQDYNGDEIAVVGSFHEAVIALADYLSANPSKWENSGASRYDKLTHEWFDDLVVERGQDDRWIVFRDGYPLGNENGPATFSAPIKAQRAADLHACDGRPNARCTGDGLSWLAPSDPAGEGEEWCLIEYSLGETVADAVEAILRARHEHAAGAIQSDTAQMIKAVFRRLCRIHKASLFGSYDAERRSHAPYFFIERQGAATARVSFYEAAHHYGKIALRNRLGPDVGDKDLREMISYVVAQVPTADCFRVTA